MSKPRRPFFVTITAVGVFLLGTWNGWRTIELAQQSTFLLQLGVRPNPYARLVMALIWSILFLTLAVALWQRRTVARRLLPFSLLLYAIYHLILLALFVQAPAARQGWQATVLLAVAAILWTTWVAYRPAYRTYWRDQENSAVIAHAASPRTVRERGDDGESKD
ncbi:MAG TPA: hypothetical protein VK879_17675 [Candidatus Sulfomarinibacteraceae bacterium]|nr:hypothetical protein [Candidatus Sulfomarinibacteraceae bacterium]